jgi:uncharacterized protein YoxC
MSIDLNLLSQYAVPTIQLILILALFWVAGIFMVLDKKLDSMRKGTDGIKSTIIELNGAIERAQNAILALKTNSNVANQEIAAKIDEANAAVETLKFLTTAAKAINMPRQSIEQAAQKMPIQSATDKSAIESKIAQQNNDLTTQKPYPVRRRAVFEDMPPIDATKRNIWGGLR